HIGRLDEIAVPGVPRHVALEERHVVAAAGQLADQPAVGRGVTVAPRGRDRQPQDRDAERALATSPLGPAPRQLAERSLDVARAMGIGMLAQHPGAGALADRARGAGLECDDMPRDLVAIARDQDLAAGFEELLEPDPC